MLIKIGFWGEKQTIEQPPNATLEFFQACIHEMSIGLCGVRRARLEKHEAGNAIHPTSARYNLEGPREGVLMCPALGHTPAFYCRLDGYCALQQAMRFNFTCLDRVFGCRVLTGDVRFHTLILSFCAEFTSERTPAGCEPGIQPELQAQSTAEDSDLCPRWGLLVAACLTHCAFAISQWISAFWNGGFPVEAWILSGNMCVNRYIPASLFLLLFVEHKWKISALICQEIHLRTPQSLHALLPLASSSQRWQLW